MNLKLVVTVSLCAAIPMVRSRSSTWRSRCRSIEQAFVHLPLVISKSSVGAPDPERIKQSALRHIDDMFMSLKPAPK